MIIWLDAHISPSIAAFLTETFGVRAQAVRDLGFREAEDKDIFFAAREADAVIMSKDSDFTTLLEQMGPPPKIMWQYIQYPIDGDPHCNISADS